MAYAYPAWHEVHAPVWAELLPPLMPNGPRRWLEIGSFEGRSACWTLDNLLTQEGDVLHCVDVWPRPEIEAAFDENVCGRAIKHKCRSESFLRADRSTYCGIYIDGSHDAPDVLTDAVLAWPRLSMGGVMIFDDAQWHHPKSVAGKVDPGVAVEAFVRCFITKIDVLHHGWQVIIKKRLA
jgi:predicted O-methyltransferase YrrM